MYKAKYIQPQPRKGADTVLHLKLYDGPNWSTAGPVLYVFDYSLNSHPGTLKGTAAFAYPGVTLDGNSDYILVTNHADLNFGATTDFTIKVSFKTSTAATQLVVSKGDFATNGFNVWITSTGVISARIVGAGGTVTAVTTIVGEFSDGKWHRLIATFDRNDTIKIYSDGVLKATSASIATVGDIDNTDNLGIGAKIGGGVGYYFNGQLDDAMIFNKLLSAAEAKSDHAITRWRYGI